MAARRLPGGQEGVQGQTDKLRKELGEVNRTRALAAGGRECGADRPLVLACPARWARLARRRFGRSASRCRAILPAVRRRPPPLILSRARRIPPLPGVIHGVPQVPGPSALPACP